LIEPRVYHNRQFITSATIQRCNGNLLGKAVEGWQIQEIDVISVALSLSLSSSLAEIYVELEQSTS
jgi:hypothetical protein